ncbi:Cytochrome c-type biogenesis protein CycH [Geodia barretti]|uniref:Cytochrome c-type biogenesis protein CycH n=1 Tax=Geodia barretti TaxID=519541 RepID=A0AA35TW23_GEOBA|nr:Cytochrome c-type biogenesis protein CycH [Geodia barretti]
MSPDERMEMIRGMVEGLAARLEENPDDAQGWRRLARSYAVLGEPEKALDTLRRAVEFAPDDLATLHAYARALTGDIGANPHRRRRLSQSMNESSRSIPPMGRHSEGIFGVYDAGIVGTSTNDITITGVGARIKF